MESTFGVSALQLPPFQLGRGGVVPKHPVPRKSPVFGKPLGMPPQAPHQHCISQPCTGQAHALLCHRRGLLSLPQVFTSGCGGVGASDAQACADFSLLQLCMVTARRSHQSDGFQSSTSLHAEATARNQTMFEDLCQAHGHLSSALQEIAQSSHAPELR